jgi:hypothetical protein
MVESYLPFSISPSKDNIFTATYLIGVQTWDITTKFALEGITMIRSGVWDMKAYKHT